MFRLVEISLRVGRGNESSRRLKSQGTAPEIELRWVCGCRVNRAALRDDRKSWPFQRGLVEPVEDDNQDCDVSLLVLGHEGTCAFAGNQSIIKICNLFIISDLPGICAQPGKYLQPG